MMAPYLGGVAMMLTGGCCCGAIRYECTDDTSDATVCHCPTCRRASGAASVAWFSVPSAGFDWLQGTPKQFRSSERVVRSFCGDCGTPLTYRHDDSGGSVDVTLCTLDDPELLAPRDQTFCRYRLGWVVAVAGLPEFENSRSEG
jgi:hypothetical protein